MTAIPAHDRTGEPVEPDDLQATGDHHCHRGWLSRPDADQPQPCLVCKPWLTTGRRPTSAELVAFEARHPKPTRRGA